MYAQTPSDKPPSNTRRSEAGFTLAEVLLASAMSAVLLTALAHSTVIFSTTVSHLEDEAGISDVRESVLRRLMREIRESWWVEVPDADHINLVNVDGEVTEFWLDSDDDTLMVRRPNGDEGVMLYGVDSFSITADTEERRREGLSEAIESVSWDAQSTPGTAPIPMAVNNGSKLGIPLTAPVLASALGGSGSEQVLGVEAETLQLALGFIPPADAGISSQLEVSLYKARGPGVAKAVGSALGSVILDSSSLPEAIVIDEDAALYQLPATTTTISLGIDADLDPGRGYVLKIVASPDEAGFVIPAHPEADPDVSTIAIKSGGGGWVSLPLVVPFDVSGDSDVTTTDVSQQVVSVTIDIGTNGQVPVTRTATVLSQSLAADGPWLGVVPGESAP